MRLWLRHEFVRCLDEFLESFGPFDARDGNFEKNILKSGISRNFGVIWGQKNRIQNYFLSFGKYF